MKNKKIGWIIIILITTTSLWIVLFALSQARTPEIVSIQDKILAIENQKTLYIANYLNAALLTLVTVFFTAAIFAHFKKKDSFWPMIASAFIPIYGLANLISYLSQVFLIPALISLFNDAETHPMAAALLELTIHTWPGSAIEALNSLAYAMLGIPFILFPLVWFRHSRPLVIGGILLAISGVLSIIAFVGLVAGFGFLMPVSIISGITFYLALFPLAYCFFSKK
jgi:hypothetical protein